MATYNRFPQQYYVWEKGRQTNWLRPDIVQAAMNKVIRSVPGVLDFFALDDLVSDFIQHVRCSEEVVEDNHWVTHSAEHSLACCARYFLLNKRSEGDTRRRHEWGGAVLLQREHDQETQAAAEFLDVLLREPDARLSRQERNLLARERDIGFEMSTAAAANFLEVAPGRALQIRAGLRKKLGRLWQAIVGRKCLAWRRQAVRQRNSDRLLQSIPCLFDALRVTDIRDDFARALACWVISATIIERIQRGMARQQAVDPRFLDVANTYLPHGLLASDFGVSFTRLTVCEYGAVLHLLAPSEEYRRVVYTDYAECLNKWASFSENLGMLFLHIKNTGPRFLRMGDYKLGHFLLDHGIALLERNKHEAEVTQLDAICKQFRAPLI